MMTAALLTLAVALCAVGVAWWDDVRALRRATARLLKAEADRDTAVRQLHAITASAALGCPVVRFRPDEIGAPTYWRVRISSREHLFSEEEVACAKRRAALLLPVRAPHHASPHATH